MKWTDEEIDKLFQNAAGKADIPYQESYWEEMEALLPAKSKKKAFWWMFGLFFALIGFASTVYLIQSNSVQSEKSHQLASKDGSATERNQLENELAKKDGSKEVGVDQTQVENLIENKTNVLDETVTSNSNDMTDNQNVTRTNSVEQGKGSGTNSQHGTGNKVVNQSQANAKNAKADKKKDRTIETRLNNQSQNTVATSVTTAPKESVTTESNRNTTNNNGSSALVKEKKENTASEKSDINPVEENTLLAEANENTIEENQALALKEAATKAQSEGEEKEKTEEEIKSITEENVTLLPEIGQSITTPSYYIQAGMRFSQSYLKTTENQLMTGISLGVGYQKIKPGIGYSIGLHATSSFVNNMEIVRRSRVYGFGVTNYEQKLKYKQLTYLELPISLNYMHLYNTFSVGVAPTYMVSTMMNFTETSESQILNQRNYYGQKIGLKTIGLEAMIGYRRAIKNNWSVGINIGMTVINQIEIDQFEHKAVSFPINGQVVIRKTLIPKR